ncbi:hypothetical protein DLAC_05929 [Tieghemostelium lacteum]|uniref:THH1/TOM1/TOM3 domain-containing protein n=1 Tax=Tieghemostelium lacteum TaxID=361077 RepID=A0A151ZHB6_TIELA|nr:hypothetical protein DLAC_05929 [Tieghemostelium lacteum]|eukprot:KYQ93270.1 hypothetical protein DLAC_05929 [Tieghemostelium lacteum]
MSNCYCDPSVILVWTGECNEKGCRAYAAIFFIGFFFTTVEAARRLFKLRNYKKTATFISLSLLFAGSLLFLIRFLLLLLKVTELRSLGVLLFYYYGGTLSSYMWILLVWCEIIIMVNFSKTIQRLIPVIRYFIILCTCAFIIALTVGISVYWNYKITNIWILILVTIEGMLFGGLGFIIWREYVKCSSITPSGTLAQETYGKIKKIMKLSIFAIVSSLIVAIIIWFRSFWVPSNNNENVVYLFLQRGSSLLWTISILSCLNAPSDPNDKSSNWGKKLKKLAFNNTSGISDDNDDEEKQKQQKEFQEKEQKQKELQIKLTQPQPNPEPIFTPPTKIHASFDSDDSDNDDDLTIKNNNNNKETIKVVIYSQGLSTP